MMKPRRVVITLGTNDNGMEVADFIANYTALVQAIQASYPYTDIIVNTIPPIPADHSTYPHMDQARIDDMNMALLNLCEQLGLKFLNTAEILKGEDGYGKPDYYTNGDIHLKSAGLKAALSYLRTHAYTTDDRRPDTANIPTRTLEYVSNPSSAVQAPSSESASESASSSTAEPVHYEAHYRVEKKGGGTLTSGGESDKTSLSYTVTDASQTISVTAVPAEAMFSSSGATVSPPAPAPTTSSSRTLTSRPCLPQCPSRSPTRARACSAAPISSKQSSAASMPTATISAGTPTAKRSRPLQAIRP